MKLAVINFIADVACNLLILIACYRFAFDRNHETVGTFFTV